MGSQTTTDAGSQEEPTTTGATPDEDEDIEMDMSKAADAAIKQGEKESKKTKKEQRRLKRQGSVTVDSSELKQLVTENDKLGEKIEGLRQQLTTIRTELMLKSESLIKEKEKTEEAEVQCEKSVAQARIYLDEAMHL